MVRAHQQPDHAPLFSLAPVENWITIWQQQQKATKEENDNINKNFTEKKWLCGSAANSRKVFFSLWLCGGGWKQRTEQQKKWDFLFFLYFARMAAYV